MARRYSTHLTSYACNSWCHLWHQWGVGNRGKKNFSLEKQLLRGTLHNQTERWSSSSKQFFQNFPTMNYTSQFVPLPVVFLLYPEGSTFSICFSRYTGSATLIRMLSFTTVLQTSFLFLQLSTALTRLALLVLSCVLFVVVVWFQGHTQRCSGITLCTQG